jgi:hypothetical protein
MIVAKRYYVGARDILASTNTHAKVTLGEAITAAEKVLEEEPTRKEVAVVQIIRVVRRAPSPVVVEQVEAPPGVYHVAYEYVYAKDDK